MSDDTEAGSGAKVVALGRGEFFAIDRRAWAAVHKLGRMNAMVAYLVLARGTQGNMRTTAWSANAVQNTTSITWGRAKEAIQLLVQAGIVRQTEGREKRGKPRYFLVPPHEIPGCEGHPPPAMDANATRLHALMTMAEGGWLYLPKNHRDRWIASEMVRHGHAQQSDNHFRAILYDAEVAAVPEWIWLPNALIDGVIDETPPVEMVRQTADLMAMRLFIDLYRAQNLEQSGGVHWTQFRREYTRYKFGEHGQYTVCGFASGQFTWSMGAAFSEHFLTGKTEKAARGGNTSVERDTGVNVFWNAVQSLRLTGLVQIVGHLIDADTEDGTILHPFPVDADGEPSEKAITVAAMQASLVMIEEEQRPTALAGYNLVPVQKHLRDVQLVGLIRLRYRARTAVTSAWLSSSADWAMWKRRYEALWASAAAKPDPFDINGRSKGDQRKIK